jgi:hypothetical protein
MDANHNKVSGQAVRNMEAPATSTVVWQCTRYEHAEDGTDEFTRIHRLLYDCLPATFAFDVGIAAVDDEGDFPLSELMAKIIGRSALQLEVQHRRRNRFDVE